MSRKKRSAGAPTATCEGACAPQAMEFDAFEDFGVMATVDFMGFLDAGSELVFMVFL
jgi:hypothetical protein